jgi:hypothetical protein
MARSGGRSQWEREMAAQRRESERQAREQARLAKEAEKARQERHFQAQQRTAERRGRPRPLGGGEACLIELLRWLNASWGWWAILGSNQ